jgi:hypothetical protein
MASRLYSVDPTEDPFLSGAGFISRILTDCETSVDGVYFEEL